jgi:hypothetical protein
MIKHGSYLVNCYTFFLVMNFLVWCVHVDQTVVLRVSLTGPILYRCYSAI